MEIFLQRPGNPVAFHALQELVDDDARDVIRIAVAFAAPPGVNLLLEALAARSNPADLKIVVGLDAGITRRLALEKLMDEFGDNARAITTRRSDGMYHPKVFFARSSQDAALAPRAMVGSANLTGPALGRNRECVGLAELSTTQGSEFDEWWDDVWGRARPLTNDLIAKYRERKPPPGGREVIGDEIVEDDPATGEVTSLSHPDNDAFAADELCVDVGVTGEGETEFEFPKAAGAFFRGMRGEEQRLTLEHAGTAYGGNRLHYESHNLMWRIDMSGDIPAVAQKQLRGATALFTRLGSQRYRFELIDDATKRAFLARAALESQTGSTTTREFGWL